MAGGLDDDDLQDDLAHDVDERLLCLGIGVLAQVIEGGVDDQFDGFRTDLRLRLPDLLPEIFLCRRLLQPGLEAGAALLERVKHIVECGEARPALGLAAVDLLDDLALFLFGTFTSPEMRRRLSGPFLTDAARFWRTVRRHHRTLPDGGNLRHDPFAFIVLARGRRYTQASYDVLGRRLGAGNGLAGFRAGTSADPRMGLATRQLRLHLPN